MKCAEIREALPAYVDDREANLTVRRHLSRCPECSADLEAYEHLREGLSAMRAVEAQPPADLFGKLTSIPSEGPAVERVRTHVVRHRNAYAGGLAIAVVGAAGAAIWRARRVRPLAA